MFVKSEGKKSITDMRVINHVVRISEVVNISDARETLFLFIYLNRSHYHCRRMDCWKCKTFRDGVKLIMCTFIYVCFPFAKSIS